MLVISHVGISQEQKDGTHATSVMERILEAISEKTASLDEYLNKNLDKSIKELPKQEEKIQKKLACTESNNIGEVVDIDESLPNNVLNKMIQRRDAEKII